jgi:hypothetical protein
MQTIEQTLFFRSSVASYYHCEKIDYIGYCLDSLHILFGNYEHKTLKKSMNSTTQIPMLHPVSTSIIW